MNCKKSELLYIKFTMKEQSSRFAWGIEEFPMEELNSQLSELNMLPISSSAIKRSDDFKEYFK